MQKFVVICFIVVVLSSQGMALQCYDCTSCSGVDSTTPVATCPDVDGTPAMCEKVEFGSLGVTTTTRRCGSGTTAECHNNIPFTTTCTCDTNLCNGAKTLQFSIVLGSLIAAILAKIFI